ncbi:hypothetical protein JD969_13480 [Planctomycetota bacterium]|nr:hypothetical protein JD969_13480 [Planctomycetota bacterium]
MIAALLVILDPPDVASPSLNTANFRPASSFLKINFSSGEPCPPNHPFTTLSPSIISRSNPIFPTLVSPLILPDPPFCDPSA